MWPGESFKGLSFAFKNIVTKSFILQCAIIGSCWHSFSVFTDVKYTIALLDIVFNSQLHKV